LGRLYSLSVVRDFHLFCETVAITCCPLESSLATDFSSRQSTLAMFEFSKFVATKSKNNNKYNFVELQSLLQVGFVALLSYDSNQNTLPKMFESKVREKYIYFNLNLVILIFH